MAREHGNYYSILGLYKDNGKANGNYYRVQGLGLPLVKQWPKTPFYMGSYILLGLG